MKCFLVGDPHELLNNRFARGECSLREKLLCQEVSGSLIDLEKLQEVNRQGTLYNFTSARHVANNQSCLIDIFLFLCTSKLSWQCL